MRRIYLIRHGKPDIPPGERICLGSSDLPLGTIGHLQACLLAHSLNDVPLSAVFCSRLSRSHQTAQYLSNHPVTLSGLEEQYYGVWDGLSFREIKERWPQLYEARGKDKSLLPEQAEPAIIAQERFAKAVKQALAQSEGDIAIVTHRSVSQLFLNSLLNKQAQAYSYELPYASVTRLELDETETLTVKQIGTVQLPELTPQLCMKLLDAVTTPHHITLHCQAVAQKAQHICSELQAAGHILDKNLITSAALLHDIARSENQHAKTGEAWLNELGYSETASIIGQHHDLKNITVIDEAAVVAMADRCVQEDKPVTLEQRFAKSAQKCTDEAAKQAFQKRYQDTMYLKDRINQLCGKELIK